jgi:hypothetical protein
MAQSLPASEQGLNKVNAYRRLKGWTKHDKVWADFAGVSTSTLRRFWAGTPIEQSRFQAICEAVGVENWKEIVDKESLFGLKTTQQTNRSLFTTLETQGVVHEQVISQQQPLTLSQSNPFGITGRITNPTDFFDVTNYCVWYLKNCLKVATFPLWVNLKSASLLFYG